MLIKKEISNLIENLKKRINEKDKFKILQKNNEIHSLNVFEIFIYKSLFFNYTYYHFFH